MKKIKNPKWKLIISMVLVLVFGISSSSNIDFYVNMKGLLVDRIKTKNLYFASIDEAGNIYRIDQSRDRITKTNKAGRVVFEKRLNSISSQIKAVIKQQFKESWYSIIVAGERNSFYVKKNTLSTSLDNSVQILKEEILLCDNNSSRNIYTLITKYILKEDNVLIIEQENTEGKMPDITYKGDILPTLSERIKYMEYKKIDDKKGFLTFAEVHQIYQQKKEQIILYNDNGTGKIIKTNEFISDDDLYINKIAGTDPENIYITTKKGMIYKLNMNSKSKELIFENTSKTNPYYITMLGSQAVFADERDRKILIIGEKGSQKEILTEGEFKALVKGKNNKDDVFLLTKSISSNGNKIVCNISDYTVIIELKDGGKSLQINDGGRLSAGLIAKGVFKIGVLIAFLVALFYLICLLYMMFIKNRINRKLVFWIFICMLLIFIVIGITMYIQTSRNIVERFKRDLSSKANFVVDYMNNSREFSKINSTSDFRNNEYKILHKYINKVQEEAVFNGIAENSNVRNQEKSFLKKTLDVKKIFNGTILSEISEGYYSILYKVEKVDNANYIFNMCVFYDEYRNPFYPYFIPDPSDRKKYYEGVGEESVNNNMITFFEKSSDADGNYLFVIMPFKYGNSEIGLYEVGIDLASLDYYIYSSLTFAFMILAILMLLLTILICFFIKRLLSPLNELQKGTEALDGVTWNKLNIKSGDDMEQISDSFNRMIDILQKVQNGYARFVPPEINVYLDENRRSKPIYDINLMDHQTMRVGVMMTGIRSFYSITGSMKAKDRFDFINKSLDKMGTSVTDNKGFIIEFLGNGIMALYPDADTTDDLLSSALDMQKRIKEITIGTSESYKRKVELGIGLHLCDKMIMGIVGYKSGLKSQSADQCRLDVAAVDEGVVLVQALEQMSKTLGASILVTKNVIENLKDKSKYEYRYLGKFSFIGIRSDEGAAGSDFSEDFHELYDVYENDDEISRKLKNRTKEQFENAVELYQARKFDIAKYEFIDIIDTNNKDAAAKIYFFLCDEYAKEEPKDWNEIVRL